MKKKIVVVGCGNIGFRHFQSLLKIISSANLWIIENSLTRIDEIKDLVNLKDKYKNNVIYSNKLSVLPKKIDFLIIATNSKERLNVLKKIINYSSIKFLLFEKFLFPKVSHYSDANKILKKNNIRSWVHTPVQDFPFFKFIINKLRKEKEFKIFIKGPEKNIGCNSIHYLSVYKEIIQNKEFKVNIAGLDKKIVNSKRKGYIEFNGNIIFSSLDKKRILYVDYPYGKKRNYFSTEIFFKNNKIIYNELSGKCRIIDLKRKKKEKTEMFKIPYVSNSTYGYVNQILKTGNCSLPRFSESALIHKKLLINFLKHINKNSKKKYNSCLIT